MLLCCGLGMNLDEDKPIDVKVSIKINEKLVVISLIGVSMSILITTFLLHYIACNFITTISSIIIGTTCLFFSLYFPVTSPKFLFSKSEILDIEEEELEELQSVMKPW